MPAAGASQRMGGGASKALIDLAGIPVLQRSLNALEKSELIDQCVVLVPPGQAQAFQAISQSKLKIDFLAGAQLRQGSVFIGLEFIAQNFNPLPSDLVLVHDAARCLVKPELIRNVIKVAAAKGAATLACPATDAVVQVTEAAAIHVYHDRSKIWNIQTPQVFRFDLLWRGHTSGICDAPDDAALVLPFGAVEIVLGSKLNCKLTTPEDLIFAAAVLGRGEI